MLCPQSRLTQNMLSSRLYMSDGPYGSGKSGSLDLSHNSRLKHMELSFINGNDSEGPASNVPTSCDIPALVYRADQALTQTISLDRTMCVDQHAVPVQSPEAQDRDGFIVEVYYHFDADGNMQTSMTPPHPGQISPVLGNGTEASQASYRKFEFVYEDPSAGPCPRKRQKRSREDIDIQKISVEKLKIFGGACLWCYRTKKKCGTDNICTQCVASHRVCVRTSEQLCLHNPPEPNGRLLSDRLRLPSQEALEILRTLMTDAFESSEESQVKIQFNYQPDPPYDNVWILGSPRPDYIPSDAATRNAVDKFANIVMQHIHCPELSQLEDTYGSLPLFKEALNMTRLFLVVQSLTTCRVHVKPFCTTQAQAILFLITTSCCQYMGEISESLSSDLCEAFRRKGLYDTHINPEHKSKKHILNPMWATAALYYRIVKGLLSLQSSSVVSQVFGPLQSHLATVRDCLWCILRNVPFQKPGAVKVTPKKAIERIIPQFEPKEHFNLVFSWVSGVPDQSIPSSPEASRLEILPDPGLGLEDLLEERMNSEFLKFPRDSQEDWGCSSNGDDLFDWTMANQCEPKKFDSASGSFQFTFQPAGKN